MVKKIECGITCELFFLPLILYMCDRSFMLDNGVLAHSYIHTIFVEIWRFDLQHKGSASAIAVPKQEEALFRSSNRYSLCTWSSHEQCKDQCTDRNLHSPVHQLFASEEITHHCSRLDFVTAAVSQCHAVHSHSLPVTVRLWDNEYLALNLHKYYGVVYVAWRHCRRRCNSCWSYHSV